MVATANSKLTSLIYRNHLLVPIISRFGIKLGFGDKTIAEICELHKVNLPFFLDIVNTFLDKDYFPKKSLQSFPAALIVAYLVKSHRFYLDYKIPKIELLISQLEWKLDHEQNLRLLTNFFNGYKKQLQSHIREEEQNAYPYALKAEAELNKVTADIVENKSQPYSISEYADSHDDIEEKLLDLKNIMIKYLPSAENTHIYSEILSEIFKLEADLNEHSRIEENVLMPKIAQIEAQLKNVKKIK